MATKVKFNISNAHIAVKTISNNGLISYDTPIAVPGSVSLSLSPKGDIHTFYADGIAYYKSAANAGYEGDWELALVTDELREKILKEIKDTKNVLLEKQDVETVEFAFGCQIDGNEKNTRIWFYNCTAARPGTEAKTIEETKEPQTDKLTLTISSEKIDMNDDAYYVRAKTTEMADEDTYNNWFNEVYIPTFIS